jgi:hypothetical protein
MERFCALCAAGCFFFVTANFGAVSHAETLFEENWNSYDDLTTVPDPAVWTLSQAAITNNAFVVMDAVDGDSEGTGDKALMYVAWGAWQETIESVATYNRDTGGDGLVIEFSAWVEGDQRASGLGFNGPFHNPDATVSYNTVEFGTTLLWNSMQWGEGSIYTDKCHCTTPDWPLFHSGEGSSAMEEPQKMQSRLGWSLGKFEDTNNDRMMDRALRMRYTLGAQQGGMIEWLDETEDPPVWVSEGDFRDGNLGPVHVYWEANPMADPPQPELTIQQGTSSLPTVRLGFLTLGIPPGHPSGLHLGNGNQELDDKTGIKRDGLFIDDILLYASAPTVGACNLIGSCQILTQTDCLAQGGTYDGDDTECMAVFNIPGDCNQDGAFDLSDVVHLLGFLFQGSPESLPCSTEAANRTLMDCNQDGGIDLSDAVYKLAFLFQGGPPSVQGEGCTEIADCPQNQACP